MIPKYINYWLRIIDTMSNQNTYKLAWGRAVLEYALDLSYKDGEDFVSMDINKLSEIVIKYYWNQLFFFNLKQAPNDNAANIIDEVNNLIELYKSKSKSNMPVWFLDGYILIVQDEEYNKTINKVTYLLIHNPGTYFPNAKIEGSNKKERLPIYEMNTENKTLTISKEELEYLKSYNLILAKLLNYKWSQLLENYNYAPKVSEKVTAISNGKVKRNRLNEIRNVLIESSVDGLAHDFYDNDNIISKDISVDHVIPWSFIYSDDIWNLVLTTKSKNSSKSNSIPTEEDINRLKIRNALLVDTIKEEKYKNALKYSIENNLLDRLFYEFKVAK